MTTRTRLMALMIAFAALGAAPALAQDVPADANEALWCSTAFALVAPQAQAQGQTQAADNFNKYAKTLGTTGHDALIKAGFTEDTAKKQIDAYGDKVNKELSGGGDAEFSVVDCTKLVDPAAAAAIQAAPAAPAAGDATTPAPAAGDTTAAPAAPAPATPAPAPAAGTTTPAPSN